MHLFPRALAVALLGAVAGALCLVGVVARQPVVSFEMDRDLPSYTSGFYPAERVGEDTFAWTAEHAEVTLSGIDRRVPWSCELRFRGARPSGLPMPDLQVAVDGRLAGAWQASNDLAIARVDVPVSPARPGLVLSLTSSPAYVPGPGDPRRLGVQVDRLACAPASGLILPPHRALGAATASAAILGAGFALTGITAGSAVGAAALMALGQAWTFNSGGTLYTGYPQAAVKLAFAIAAAMALLVAVLERRRPALRNTARFAITFAAGALFLQVLALLHPGKNLVDALFHAHRLQYVLAGRLYFTQLSTSATPFPYAIGLYLFSVPWMFFASNYVGLLWTIVSAAEVIAGGLLYTLVVKTSGNRLAGAVAVALFILTPVSYGIIGNANLTNAFGQAVSIVTIASLAILAARLRRPVVFGAMVALTTLGLISHISTLVLLTSTLLVLAALFWRLGGEPLRGAARAIVAITAVSLLASTVIYWGHFGDVYRVQLARLKAAVTRSVDGPHSAEAPTRADERGELTAIGERTFPVAARLRQAFDQTTYSIGWPVLLLSVVGFWRVIVDGSRGRLELVTAAWAIVCAVFMTASIVSPGNKTYQQDAFEFIGRVLHATLPAAILLAARGAEWGWRAGMAPRSLSIVALAWAVLGGVRSWTAWLG